MRRGVRRRHSWPFLTHLYLNVTHSPQQWSARRSVCVCACVCSKVDDGWMEGSLLENFIFGQCTEGQAKEDTLVFRVVSDDLRPVHHLKTVYQNVQFPQIQFLTTHLQFLAAGLQHQHPVIESFLVPPLDSHFSPFQFLPTVV